MPSPPFKHLHLESNSELELASKFRALNTRDADMAPNEPDPVKVGLPSLSLFLPAILFLSFLRLSAANHEANEYTRQFVASRGNEYFCEIDEEYLTDRFNLTGLNTEVHYYQHALDLVNDSFDLDCDDEMREAIEKSARHLYGLVHARYIVTTRGLAKMVS